MGTAIANRDRRHSHNFDYVANETEQPAQETTVANPKLENTRRNAGNKRNNSSSVLKFS